LVLAVLRVKIPLLELLGQTPFSTQLLLLVVVEEVFFQTPLTQIMVKLVVLVLVVEVRMRHSAQELVRLAQPIRVMRVETEQR
jgi:hypothetical protein